MLTYYQNLIGNCSISPTPNEEYRNEMQAMIQEQWENTSAMYTIQEQVDIGSENYNNIEVWLDYVVSQGSSFYRNGDDFRQVIFKEIIHPCIRGRLYKFDNNFWLSYFTDEYSSVVKSLALRRCNNFMRWVDKETGAIKSVPCVVDYEVGSSRPKQDKDIQVADNSMVVWVQGNTDTRSLKQNQRFIFNNRPFKLAGFNNSLQKDIVTDNTDILYYDLYLDIEQPTDDLDNDIANRFEYNYSIQIIPDVTEQVNGFVGKLNANVVFNGEVVERPVTWTGNEYVTITGDTYTLNGVAGDVVILTANITGNSNAFDSISIKIVETVIDNYEIVINPLNTEIRQNQTLVFRADLYKNGAIQPDAVNGVVTNLDTTYYTFSMVGNECTLTCKKFSSTPLIIDFTSGVYSKQLQLKLKSAF